jgi:DNA polymerase delta subunit 2
MPGLHDVGSVLLPQKPLNKCLFDNTEKLELVTNPCTFQLNGKTILGISGMSIIDIMEHSDKKDAIEIMKEQLEWRHICPTAPDTLRTYPFEETDPFVLKESPNVFFAGNQSKFDTTIISHNDIAIRFISIPRFVDTQKIAVLDIETLEAFELDLSQPN